MLQKNDSQFTTNNSMLGNHVTVASIEIINGIQNLDVFRAWKDIYVNAGFIKLVRLKANKIKGNMLADRIGSSVASLLS